MKEVKEVKELKYTLRMDAWIDVSIKIVDEEMFKDKCLESIKKNENIFDYYDLIEPRFENCVNVEYSEVSWIEEDIDEDSDLFYIDEFLEDLTITSN
jgi:hypothetical protein